MSELDLLVVTNLDQPIIINKKMQDALDRIDDVIAEAKKEKSPHIALATAIDLLTIGKISGVALAKLLYLIEKNWKDFSEDDESDPQEYIYTTTGLHKHTVERYVKVWAMYADGKVPDEVAPILLSRNIRDQVVVANALAQGYEIEGTDWNDIVDAEDYSAISKAVKDVTGKESRSGGITIYLDNVGSLYAFHNGTRYFVGSLETNDDDPTVQRAIQRIIKNAGITSS